MRHIGNSSVPSPNRPVIERFKAACQQKDCWGDRRVLALLQTQQLLIHLGWKNLNMTIVVSAVNHHAGSSHRLWLHGLAAFQDGQVVSKPQSMIPLGNEHLLIIVTASRLFLLPIIRNTHLLPHSKPWIYFESLSKQYKPSEPAVAQ